MDTSSSRSSAAKLAIVKGQRHLRERLTPSEMANLLFDEASELESKNLARFIIDQGRDVGIRVDDNLVLYSWLGLPEIVTAVVLVGDGAFIKRGGIYDFNKFGHPMYTSKQGVLLLGRDDNDHALWLWSEIWLPYPNGSDHESPRCTVLDVDSLTELMTTRDDGRILLKAGLVYGEFTKIVHRQSQRLSQAAINLGAYSTQTQQRYERQKRAI